MDFWTTLTNPSHRGSLAAETSPPCPPHQFYFKIFFFSMWTIFKVFIEFVTILLLFYVLVFWSRGMWDLSSPTRDRTRTPCIGRQSLNHWTAREVPTSSVLETDIWEASWLNSQLKETLGDTILRFISNGIARSPKKVSGVPRKAKRRYPVSGPLCTSLTWTRAALLWHFKYWGSPEDLIWGKKKRSYCLNQLL